ncbi:MAG: DegV family protein [Sphaerochaetaceae bacterium]|nr:DegV family protein [Sphaerochaetaceae bacterium]
MEKIGLLIDSTTLTRKDLQEYNFLKVAQLKVHFDDVHYDESELTKEAMEKMITEGKHLKTSQPSPVDFLNKFQEFYDEGYTHVISVVLSSKLSGTYQSALVARSMIEFPLEVDVHSPMTASYGVALGVKKIAEMISSGAKYSEVIKKYYVLFDKPFTSFTLGDLMNLYRGGRLSRVSAFIGKVLRIKPVIEMIEGKLELVKKERTNKACLDIFINKLDEYVKNNKKIYLDIININMPEWGKKVLDIVKEKYNEVEIHMTDYLSPVFYSHLGNKGFGVAILAE